jgi:hypothetical protein
MAFGMLARRVGAGAWLLACVALLAGCASPAPPRGSVHEGSVALGTRTLPLPPGPWTVLSDAERASQLADGPGLAVRTIVLVQEKDGRPTGVIRVTATDAVAQGVQYLPGGIPACLNDNSNLRPAVVDVGQRHVDCRRVFLRAPISLDAAPSWADLAAALTVEGAAPANLPLIAPSVLFGLGDGTGPMQVEFIFIPETRGMPPETHPWHESWRYTRNRTPQHEAYIARLADWAEAAHPAIRAGFAGQVPPRCRRSEASPI